MPLEAENATKSIVRLKQHIESLTRKVEILHVGRPDLDLDNALQVSEDRQDGLSPRREGLKFWTATIAR